MFSLGGAFADFHIMVIHYDVFTEISSMQPRARIQVSSHFELLFYL